MCIWLVASPLILPARSGSLSDVFTVVPIHIHTQIRTYAHAHSTYATTTTTSIPTHIHTAHTHTYHTHDTQACNDNKRSNPQAIEVCSVVVAQRITGYVRSYCVYTAHVCEFVCVRICIGL